MELKKSLCILSLLALSLFASAQRYAVTKARNTPEWFRKGLTYQIQPRAFTKEGTLTAAESKLAHLKEIGVSTIYLWPVFVADDDTSRVNWSPRQIQSGFNNPRNPYRMKDYWHVDEEYGGDEALRHFVKVAHSEGLHVLLDLVYCHCGPGAVCVKEHPEFFKYDKNGKMELTRWNFPKFDFECTATRIYFKSLALYWMCDFGVDGFRCDVADAVPLDFWTDLRSDMEKLNPQSVLVAEGRRPDNMHYAFDANYNWPVFMDAVREVLSDPGKYASKGGAAYIRERHEQYTAKCPDGALNWNMTENHDWSNNDYHNRAEKKFGHANREIGLALCFALDGIPMLYNGQEFCDTCRHSIYSTPGKCCIDWSQKDSREGRHRMEKIRIWMKLRNDYSCVHYGKTVWIDNDESQKICSFRRSDGISEDVLWVGNLSAETVKVRLADGTALNLGPYKYIFCPQSELKTAIREENSAPKK